MIRVGPDELDLLRFECSCEEAQGGAARVGGGTTAGGPRPLARAASGRPRPRVVREWRFFGSKSSALRHSNSGSTPTSRSDALQSSSAKSRCWSASTRSASGYARRSCRRSMAPAARLKRSRSIARRAACSSTSSGSSRARPCASSSRRSFARTRLSARARRPPLPRQRAVLVVASNAKSVDDLLAIAEPLARRPARELILARLVRDDGALGAESVALSAPRRARRSRRGVSRRHLHDVGTGCGHRAPCNRARCGPRPSRRASGLLATGRPDHDLAVVLERAPCDVAVLVGSWRDGRPARS